MAWTKAGDTVECQVPFLFLLFYLFFFFSSFSAEEGTTALLVFGERSDTHGLSRPFNNWNRITRTGQAGKRQGLLSQASPGGGGAFPGRGQAQHPKASWEAYRCGGFSI